jgi:tetratricopeptide (TPR) repeat protein
VADARKELLERPPWCVVIRGRDAWRPPDWEFVWAPLYETVTNCNTLVQSVGPYEIWAPPQGALARCQSAEALRANGQTAEAITQYTEALRLEPDLCPALNNLAWIRAAHSQARFRDGPEAVRLAERACRLTGYQRPLLVGTLAAAYAEAGRFDEAAASVEKARSLAQAAGWNEVAEKDQQLLELFKARQPFHETAPIPR